MICQECEEEYQLEGLRFDQESFRIFGSFRCGCKIKLVLPEEDCLRLGLLDFEAREQLKHLRLIGFRLLLDKERSPGRIYSKAFESHQEHLIKYLKEVSGKS